jgi:predicted DNA-binding transcriptional regulator AlpA
MDDFQGTSRTKDKYLKLKAMSAYSGISIRKLRECIKDAEHPLPCFRMEGMILVKRSEFDRWMERHFRLRKRDIDQVIDEVMKGL